MAATVSYCIAIGICRPSDDYVFIFYMHCLIIFCNVYKWKLVELVIKPMGGIDESTGFFSCMNVFPF